MFRHPSIPRVSTLALIALVVAVSAVLVAPRIASTVEPAESATVSFLEGEAFKSADRGFEQRVALSVGARVERNEYIRTSANSRMELTLNDGSRLRVAESTTLRVNRLLFQSGSRRRQFDMQVETGRVWATVNRAIGSDSSFEVRTENAVAGVRGTIFRVDSDDEATIVRVYSGAVAVRYPVYASQQAVEERQRGQGGPRRQVQGPRQVSQQEWEEAVAQELQGIVVGRNREMRRLTMDLDEERREAWVAWNMERDRQVDLGEAPGAPGPATP